MKRTLTTLTVAALGAMSGSNAIAYFTVYGEDLNDSNTRRLVLADPNCANPVFTSLCARSIFEGQVNNPAQVRVETLETQPVGTPPGSSLSLAFGGGNRTVSATLSGGNGRIAEVLGTPTYGQYSVPDGNRFWSVNAGAPGSTFTITFDENVEAFGFFGVDIADFDGKVDLELGYGIGRAPLELPLVTNRGARNGSVLYFGIVAASADEFFRSITFKLSNSTRNFDEFGFDGFTVVGAERVAPPPPPPPPGPPPPPPPGPPPPPPPGPPPPPPNQVPEPGTLALTGLALLFMRAARRRRN